MSSYQKYAVSKIRRTFGTRVLTYPSRAISYTWRGKLKLSAGAFRTLIVIFVLCTFNLVTAAVFAQEGQIQEETVVIPEIAAANPIAAAEQELSWENSAAGAAQPVSAVSTLSILRVLLTLAVAAAAIYGIVFFIKRLSRGNSAWDPFLKVLASAPLGTNRGVHIISVGSQAWLVGAAENGVNLISEIQDKDILNAMLLEDSRRSADGEGANGGRRLPDFRALLHKLGAPAASDTPPGPEEIRKRSERLKGL